MVFNKKRSDDRKYWLENVYDRKSFADTRKQMIPYEEFIHKELIHFSKYDCDRSIPNLMDGLKISLRKILYSAFKKRLSTEIKVAQFSGYVSENSCYHHGEESLNQAIVGMAQNFVGSNNINLLFPSGQFGSRIKGGKDSASPRYIFTRLEKITRLLFPEQDDSILKYLNDDGTPVEPMFYVPIIPMVLVNGTKGIGTGFSTDIMCYNPRDIITYLKCKLRNEMNDIEFIPHYEGFQGSVKKLSETKFLFRGRYEKVSSDVVRVTELPIGYWTEDFKELLEELLEDKDKDGKKITPMIKSYDSNSTDTKVDYTITFAKGKLEELESSNGEHDCNGVEKLLKLYSTSSTTNMNLFNHEDKLTKYGSVSEIIDDYYGVRLEHYDDRKEYMINEIEKCIKVLSNKSRYIKELLNDTIDLRKKKKDEIVNMLVCKNYEEIDGDNEFKYLVKMPMDSVSEENVNKVMNELGEKTEELERIKETTIEQMWLYELEMLETEYIEYLKERSAAAMGESKPKVVNKTGVKRIVKLVK